MCCWIIILLLALNERFFEYVIYFLFYLSAIIKIWKLCLCYIFSTSFFIIGYSYPWHSFIPKYPDLLDSFLSSTGLFSKITKYIRLIIASYYWWIMWSYVTSSWHIWSFFFIFYSLCLIFSSIYKSLLPEISYMIKGFWRQYKAEKSFKKIFKSNQVLLLYLLFDAFNL